MPRSNGIYSPPPGTGGTPQTTISSAMFNAFVADITADQNNPRPIIAGGTGSATSQGAIDAFFGAPRTIVDERLLFVDPVDVTKRVRLDAGNITAGQTRVLTMPDENLNLGDLLPKPGGTMTGLLTLAPADDDPAGTASLNIPAGADVPDVQTDGDLWADSNEDLRYRRGGADATLYDSVNLPRPAPGEMAAGTETAPRALSAADVRASGVFSKSYKSSEQALTLDGSLTLSHGLGKAPSVIQLYLVNKIAEGGYSPGDVVSISSGSDHVGAATGYGTQAWLSDATNIRIKFGSAAFASLISKSTGGIFQPATAANWRLIVEAFS